MWTSTGQGWRHRHCVAASSCVTLRPMTAPDLRRDWRHLGRTLRAARGGRSRAEVERESGVSATQIKRYEAGVVTPPEIPDKMWMLAAYYGWTPDSVEKVLAGGEPMQIAGTSFAPPIIGPPDPEILDKLITLVGQADGFTGVEKRIVLRWLLAQAS